MPRAQSNPKVDAFLASADRWREEMTRLRKIVLGFPFAEELKWSKPCYSFEGGNVAIIIPFKESCALMYCKGALLKDAKGVLEKPGEHTQGARWIKFRSVPEVVRMEPTVKAYLKEAIAAEKAGLQVKYRKTSDYKVPPELEKAFAHAPALKAAFAGLTPGRQRAYLLFISSAKQSQTREARIEKHRQRILAGKGLND
ncbi:MAG TPA: YdeI/OmpD-associated family protein [Opitutaceae bacterium]|nr:YdeI/OmpD-associated family protein [Opitutaceae bacterium]